MKSCPLCTSTIFFDACVLIHSRAIFGHVRLSKPKATLTASCVVVRSGGKANTDMENLTLVRQQFCSLLHVGWRERTIASLLARGPCHRGDRRDAHTWGLGVPEVQSCKRQAGWRLAAFQIPGGQSVQPRMTRRAGRRRTPKYTQIRTPYLQSAEMEIVFFCISCQSSCFHQCPLSSVQFHWQVIAERDLERLGLVWYVMF